MERQVMKLIFLGTKGEIEEHTKKHNYNSSLLIENKKFRLLIDYGKIQKNLELIKPDAILITHAHQDHYAWTKKEILTEIKVYLTKETLDYGKFKPKNYRIIKPGKKVKIGNLSVLPYRVNHSIICPALGFKIFVNKKSIMYNPDLVSIINKDKILRGTDYYIGDGSSIRANLVRKRNGKFFGHSRISTQINWCKKSGIKKIIFTHLGKETIRKEKEFSRKNNEITLAYDGMKIEI